MTRLVYPALVAAFLASPFAVAQTPAPAAAAPTGDANRGAQKVSMCQGCHGIPGWRTAFPEVYRVPKLSGQAAPYIIAALKEYRSGNRAHPTMKAIAGPLSDGDMADIAAYYSQVPLTTAAQ